MVSKNDTIHRIFHEKNQLGLFHLKVYSGGGIKKFVLMCRHALRLVTKKGKAADDILVWNAVDCPCCKNPKLAVL